MYKEYVYPSRRQILLLELKEQRQRDSIDIVTELVDRSSDSNKDISLSLSITNTIPNSISE